MKLPEIRTSQTVKIDIPVQFTRLRDLAYNLWWTWTPEAQKLFRKINEGRWQRYRNPVELLTDLEPERWYTLQNDEQFVRDYRSIVQQFDNYMFPRAPTWFECLRPAYDQGPIVYFSTEFGWHECLQIYSGGLGILSGDHTKSASDLGLPFVGMGLMYRHGYFRQTIDADGQQQHFYPDYDLNRVPLLPVVDEHGRDLRIALDFPGRRIHVGVLKAAVGRVPVLLLNTDVEENHPADRSITSVLYISGREMRFCQELVLGLGGAQVLSALGISPAVWHMNEGHSALLSLERLRARIRRGDEFDRALERVSSTAVFTTHTPVPAGNETFEESLIRTYLGEWSGRNQIDIERVLALARAGDPADTAFNMTALAVRTSARVNGVSALHGEVAGEIWNGLIDSPDGRKVEHVTNGVHVPTWLGPEMSVLIRNHLGSDFHERLLEPGFAEAIDAIPDAQLWNAHMSQKHHLIRMTRDRLLNQFARHGRSPDELHRLDNLIDPESLLIGFARRFATYKRADLILRDLEKLMQIVGNEQRPVQFLFAGKAHPADRPGQELIRRVWQASRDDKLGGRVLFLESYDMHIGRNMVQGVDMWLNTPRRPLEASGTSGMKVAINGGLNCSILDGWWCEGYDPSHGWIIGDPNTPDDHDHQDREDAESLYRVLADEIATCYYDRDDNRLPRNWIARMKRAIGSLSPKFSTQRMVREYTESLYLPQAQLTREDDSQPVSPTLD